MIYSPEHITASVVAAVVYMVVGMFWFSSVLFGKPWMKMTFGSDKKSDKEMKKGMGVSMLGTFIMAMIAACILRSVMLSLGVDGAGDGARMGLYLGVGFVATTQLIDALWGKKPLMLFLINAGHHVLAFTIIGALLATWPL